MDDEVYSAHLQLEESHWWFSGRRRILFPLVAEAMRGTEESLIVDVGCGTGGTLAALAERYRCIGLDSSPQAIAIAKSKFPEGDFRCGPFSQISDEVRQSAALYMLMDVLEHVETPDVLLAEVAQAARPGAHILVTVPAAPALWSRHDVAAGHLRRYERETLEPLWRYLPLRARLVTYFNSRLFPLIWLARNVGRRYRLVDGIGDSDFSMPPPLVNRALTEIFAGESRRVERMLADPAAKGYPRGVSLVALLQRRE